LGGQSLRKIEFPYAVGYYFEKGIIVDHWMITDQVALLEQLGQMDDGKWDNMEVKTAK